MQQLNYNFSYKLLIPFECIILDKKERDTFSLNGYNIGNIGTINNDHVIGGSYGKIHGNTKHNYIFIIKNIFTEKNSEINVDVNEFYNHKIGDHLYYKDGTYITNLNFVNEKNYNSIFKSLKLKQLEIKNNINELKKSYFSKNKKKEELIKVFNEIGTAMKIICEYFK